MPISESEPCRERQVGLKKEVFKLSTWRTTDGNETSETIFLESYNGFKMEHW